MSYCSFTEQKPRRLVPPMVYDLGRLSRQVCSTGENKEKVTKDYHLLKRAILMARPRLISRLNKLLHPYHNKRHSHEVVSRVSTILNFLKKEHQPNNIEFLLIKEAALRHDDGNCGFVVRQGAIGFEASRNEGKGLSNEEKAVELMYADYSIALKNGWISMESLEFMKKLILGTTYGQNSFEPSDPRYRGYKANTLYEKILKLADGGGVLFKSWDEWIQESFDLFREDPNSCPKDVHNWLLGRINFLDYLISTLKEIVDFLEPDFAKEKLKHLEDMKTKARTLLGQYYITEETLGYSLKLDQIRKIIKY